MNKALIRQLANTSKAIDPEQAEYMLGQHRRFVASGGRHGHWTVLSVVDLPLAIYHCAAQRGEQASLQLRHIPPSYQGGVSLPAANFAGALGERMDFRFSDFSTSVFVDGFFAGSDFSGCVLHDVDFSRADLRCCRFVQAHLCRADFEDADLRGADFTGSHLDEVVFPNALLQSVQGLPRGIIKSARDARRPQKDDPKTPPTFLQWLMGCYRKARWRLWRRVTTVVQPALRTIRFRRDDSASRATGDG